MGNRGMTNESWGIGTRGSKRISCVGNRVNARNLRRYKVLLATERVSNCASNRINPGHRNSECRHEGADQRETRTKWSGMVGNLVSSLRRKSGTHGM